MPADDLLAARSHARISASPASRATTQNLADFTSTLYPPIGGPGTMQRDAEAIAYALAAGGAQCSIAASPFRIDSQRSTVIIQLSGRVPTAP
jgi:hypothetical protein